MTSTYRLRADFRPAVLGLPVGRPFSKSFSGSSELAYADEGVAIRPTGGLGDCEGGRLTGGFGDCEEGGAPLSEAACGGNATGALCRGAGAGDGLGCAGALGASD